MGKAQKEISCSDTPQYLKPSFNPQEIVEKAVDEFIPPVYPFEAEHRDFFENRKKAEKADVARLFKTWLNDFAGLWDAPEALAQDAPTVLAKWDALLFHHEASVGFAKTRREVAESVFLGRGFKGDGNLGGNPFFDVAVTVACVGRQSAAFLAFERAYRQKLTGKAVAWASKVQGRGVQTLEIDAFQDWYSDFQTRILTDGLTNGYGGKCGLLNYLAPILAQFWGRIAVKAFQNQANASLGDVGNGERAYEPADERADVRFDDSEDAEVLRPLTRQAIDAALRRTSDVRRRVLRLRVGDRDSDGLPNNEVARLCGITPQQASAYYAEARQEIIATFARMYDADRRKEIFEYMKSTGADDLVTCLSKVDGQTGGLI